MGRKKDLRERFLGPYERDDGRWELVHVLADERGRASLYFPTERAALKEKAELEGEIVSIIRTTDTVREDFIAELRTNKRSERTIEGYEWAFLKFWPVPILLREVTAEALEKRYAVLRGELAVDSHRNALKMAKTLLRFCAKKKWIQKIDLEEVQGQGDRNHRKPQLLIDESRAFYRHALANAQAGDPGAIAALLCLLLTLRSETEALSITARAIDDGGAVLWVLESKTKAGLRGMKVPPVLCPILLALKAGRGPEEFLFRRRDRKWLWDQVAQLCLEAGVPRVPPHGLRGMHSTIATVKGATAEMVADALGHEDTKVTMESYIEPAQAQEAQQARVLRLVKGGRE